MTDVDELAPTRADPVIEAERFVLGALMIEIDRNPGADHLAPGDFYLPRHGRIFAVIREGLAADEPVDPIAVGDRLRASGDLERCGDLPYLHQCAAVALGSAGTVGYHAGIIRAAAARRTREQLVARASQIAGNDEQWAKHSPDLLAALAEPTATATTAGVFVDVAAVLDGGLPEAPPPVLLRREDGHALFYTGKVNVLFGDPECGKTWIALAAIVEALEAGDGATVIDLDHNGAIEIVSRLVILGAKPDVLRDRERFRLVEPEDSDHLIAAVAALRSWGPRAALVDSLGEMVPLLGLSSSNPDDYTIAHRRVLTPLAAAGAAVIAVDHLPKADDARAHGQTGTLAKRRAVNGVSLRVTVVETFAPGRGGAASMTVEKDRSGGVRAHCPDAGQRPPAGRFVMTAHEDGTTTWRVTVPRAAAGSGEAPDGVVPDEDVAELDGLVPPPRSKRDVQDRCGWGSNRAQKALSKWRELRKPAA